MTAAELSGRLPLGWAATVRDDGDGIPVYVARSADEGGALHFESTSPLDLVDQVHETLDAAQTALELHQAMAPTMRRRASR